MNDFEKAIQIKNEKDHFCKKCGRKMTYSPAMGEYSCEKCHIVQKDTYGKLKELLHENPKLSLMELSLIMGIPIKELSHYVEDGVLINPKQR